MPPADGNVANDPEKASEAGHKGGKNSNGGGRNS
ncbi:KGG domain-containing protein [Modicisalibacter zincidurans]